MGLGGISVWQLLIILVIILLIFGPSRLKNIGSQLGTAVKDFRKTMKDNEDESSAKADESARLGGKSQSESSEQVKQSENNKS